MNKDIVDLMNIFSDLAAPTEGANFYTAQVIPGRPNYRIGKDVCGNPALLIKSSHHRTVENITSFQLRYLSFEAQCLCRVTSAGLKSPEEILSVLKCTTNDSILREYFLRSLSGLVAAIPKSPSERDIAALVDTLVELFRTLELPAKSSLEGTWCELFLIQNARDANLAAVAWHADSRNLHDFVDRDQHVEVKSTVATLRIHNFTSRQLSITRDYTLAIASFMLTESDLGWSVRDVWDSLCSRSDLTDESRNRVSRILMGQLGKDWLEARHVRFDPESARRELRVYMADQIPKVDCDLPATVSDVRFKSELTSIIPQKRSRLKSAGGLLGAMFG
jgi:hypothetical protein